MAIYDHVIIFLPPRNNVTKLTISVYWSDSQTQSGYPNSEASKKWWRSELTMVRKIETYIYLCLLIVPLLNWQQQPIIKSATISFSSLVRSASLTVWSFFFYWHERWRGWLCRRLNEPFHVLYYHQILFLLNEIDVRGQYHPKRLTNIIIKTN